MTRSDSKSLQEEFPEIAVWFDAQANGFTADEITSRNPKKVHWKCGKGHEFIRPVENVTRRGFVCSYCTGRLASPENNLRVHHPDLADMFDKAENGKLATEVTAGGGKGKVRWTCVNDHTFLKSVAESVRTKGICRECNSLAFKFPDLRTEYSSKNKLTFDALSYGSNKNVLWVCSKGHEWKTPVHKRTVRGDGCPTCAGRHATEEINLAVARPDVAIHLDEEKTGKPATAFRPSSNQLVWWRCDNGHSYDISPNKKTSKIGYGCPYCSGYRVDETNSLTALFPLIAKEFMVDKNGVSPDLISVGGSTPLWWKCTAQGHEWKAAVSARTSRNSGCPYCSGRYATPDTNLLKVRPLDADQFNTKKNGITPNKVSPYSNIGYWWTCEKGHEWNATPNAKKGCGQCSMNQVSKVERELRKVLFAEGIALSLGDNHKLDIPWRKNRTMSVDIICKIAGRDAVVEYDGYYYHSGEVSKDPTEAKARDIAKSTALLNAGYKLVRVRETSSAGRLGPLNIDHPNLLQIEHRYNYLLPDGGFDHIVSAIKGWNPGLSR